MACENSGESLAVRSRSTRSSTWFSGCMASPFVVAYRCMRCQMRPVWRRWAGSRGSRTTRVPKAAAVGTWVSRVARSHASSFCPREAGSSFPSVRISGARPAASMVMPSFCAWSSLQVARY